MKNQIENEEEIIFIKNILKEVIDPELMVNIIDLGLIYDIRLEKDKKMIEVDLTLTSTGCPLGDVIIQNIEQLLYRNYLGFIIKVNLVWVPVWNADMMTEEGKIAMSNY